MVIAPGFLLFSFRMLYTVEGETPDMLASSLIAIEDLIRKGVDTFYAGSQDYSDTRKPRRVKTSPVESSHLRIVTVWVAAASAV